MSQRRRRNGNHSQKYVDKINMGRFTEQATWLWKQTKALEDDFDDKYNDKLNWEMIIKEIKYIANFFKFNDKELNKQRELIVYHLYFFGKVGIMPIKDKYSIFAITQLQENDFNEIKIANGLKYIVRTIGNAPSESEFTNLENVVLSNNETALVKTDAWARPWYWFLQRFIEEFKDINTSQRINRINSRALKAIDLKGEAAFNEERNIQVKKLHNGKNPINVVYGLIGDIVDLSLENQADKINKDWQETHKRYCLARGIRDNVERKSGDSNLVDELRNSDVQFETIEEDRLSVFVEIAEKLTKLTGKKITVKTILDIKDEKEHEQAIELKETEPESDMIEAEAKMITARQKPKETKKNGMTIRKNDNKGNS